MAVIYQQLLSIRCLARKLLFKLKVFFWFSQTSYFLKKITTHFLAKCSIYYFLFFPWLQEDQTIILLHLLTTPHLRSMIHLRLHYLLQLLYINHDVVIIRDIHPTRRSPNELYLHHPIQRRRLMIFTTINIIKWCFKGKCTMNRKLRQVVLAFWRT